MTELSPAAQAVLAIYEEAWSQGYGSPLASALRAAAEVVAPVSYEDIYTDGRMLQYERENPVREKLLAIADELEPQ